MKLKELLINKLEEPIDAFCKKINIFIIIFIR